MPCSVRRRCNIVINTYTEPQLGGFLFGHETGHSIARPTACGGRVPPQRTALRKTAKLRLLFLVLRCENKSPVLARGRRLCYTKKKCTRDV